MQWLGNNGIGHHPVRVGFVSITTCQAIVYVTEQNIFGLHNYDWGSRGVNNPDGTVSQKSADDWLELKAAAFAQFVQSVQINHQNNARIMYAVVNAGQRYSSTKGDVDAWKSDVRVFAKALKFKGERIGIRVPADVGNGGGVNVLFDRKNNPHREMQIFYQKYDKAKWSNTGANRNPHSGSTRGIKISSTAAGTFATEHKDDGDVIGHTMQDATHAHMTQVAADGREWKRSKSFLSY